LRRQWRVFIGIDDPDGPDRAGDPLEPHDRQSPVSDGGVCGAG
jgi:hypothetical protein